MHNKIHMLNVSGIIKWNLFIALESDIIQQRITHCLRLYTNTTQISYLQYMWQVSVEIALVCLCACVCVRCEIFPLQVKYCKFVQGLHNKASTKLLLWCEYQCWLRKLWWITKNTHWRLICVNTNIAYQAKDAGFFQILLYILCADTLRKKKHIFDRCAMWWLLTNKIANYFHSSTKGSQIVSNRDFFIIILFFFVVVRLSLYFGYCWNTLSA